MNLNSDTSGLNIAVIGGSAAGLSAAYRLSGAHHVTLYDKNPSLTLPIPALPESDLNFPILLPKKSAFQSLMHDAGLNLPTQASSFSHRCRYSDFLYATNNAFGLFGQKRHVVSLSFYAFLLDIMQFKKKVLFDLAHNLIHNDSLEDYFMHYGFSSELIEQYVYPLSLQFFPLSYTHFLALSAPHFFSTLARYGALSGPLFPKFTAGTLCHTDSTEALCSTLHNCQLNTSISQVRRHDNGVTLVCSDGAMFYHDCVVFATAADTSLSLLENPNPEESRLLGAWHYDSSTVFFHRDSSMLPHKKRCWASVNSLRILNSPDTALSCSYILNSELGLDSFPLIATFNPQKPIDPAYFLYRSHTRTPRFTPTSVQQQEELSVLQGVNRSFYCGSFMTDGQLDGAVRSGEQVAALFS